VAEKTELSDDRKEEILKLVQSECARSIGFDNVNAGELVEQREKALNYIRGEMPDLVMELAGRSKMVSMDVADAIETALPDLMDIFTGSDDVVAFEPVNQDDVAAAKQEADYLRHVLFTKNSGWMAIYEAFKDALTCKTGVFSWRWEGEYEPPTEEHTGKSLVDMVKAHSEGTVDNIQRGEDDEQGLPTFSYEFRPANAKGRVVIESIAPEDLAVAPDTRTLSTATYCCVRSRPRAQDLLAIGYDAEAIEKLPPWNNLNNSLEAYARDTVAESQVIGQAHDVLRQVEIYRHYVRVWEEDENAFCVYQVVTGGKGYTTVLIDIDEVSRIQLAAITPYINPHRFYGDSIADKLMEIQKIKSSLMRMALDSGYFALNQRMEVADTGVNDYTIDDLLNNDPGRPIRVRVAGTITPVTSGALNYDPLEHLEYFSTVAEQRTGIVRNAQGLNPDTLHDTKGGLELLAGNAQKRLRMIARVFAETGYKDFLVNLHATIRETGASMRDTIRLRDQWVDIDPSTWRQRDDMTIQIGVGAGGRDHDIIVGQQLAAIQAQLLEAQALPDGPLISKENLYKSSMFVLDKLGLRSPEQFVSDPSKFKPPQQTPPPDPALMKVQQDGQIAQAQMQMDAQQAEQQRQLDEAQAVADHQAKQDELALKQQQIEREDQYKRDQAAAELQLKREQLAEEARLKQYEIDANIALQREQMAHDWQKHMAKIEADTRIASSVKVGGEPG
jgi:hypothetical protein